MWSRTSGATPTRSSPHGLIYQWQSGALNESYSDIWGDLVDQINGAGTDTPGGARTVGRCSSFANNWPTVIVNQPAPGTCAAAPAEFGSALTTTGVTGDVVLSNDGKGSPTDGCTSPNNAQAINGNIALVDRGICAFTVKVANMQKVGATGVMIANNVFGGPTIMPGVDPSILIPSVMITIGQGAAFKEDLAAGTVNVTMRARTGSQGSYRWLMGEDATRVRRGDPRHVGPDVPRRPGQGDGPGVLLRIRPTTVACTPTPGSPTTASRCSSTAAPTTGTRSPGSG